MPQSSFTPLRAIFFSMTSPMRRTFRFDLAQRRALGRDVAVVEGEERRAQQAEELEGDVGLLLRLLPSRRRRRRARGAGRCSPPNGSMPAPDEAVPVAHREAQVLRHALAQHLALRVVPAVVERSVAGLEIRAFVAQRLGQAEVAVSGGWSWRWLGLERSREGQRANSRSARIEALPVRVALACSADAVGARLEGAQPSAAAATAQAVAGGQAREPRGAERAADLALGHLVQRHAEHVGHHCAQSGERAPPPISVGLARARAGVASACCASRSA